MAVVVCNGTVTDFNANMAFNNGAAGHTHEFQNFIGKNNQVGLSKIKAHPLVEKWMLEQMGLFHGLILPHK